MKNSKPLFLLFTISFVFIHCVLGEEKPWAAQLKQRLETMADSLTANLTPWNVPDRTFDIRDYGAIADTSILNTVAIQKAIDACSEAGGGVVLVKNGDYVTGTIDLKSGVMLEVAEGSRILGSTSFSDYPQRIEALKNIMSEFYEFRYSLIYAEKCKNIGIRGKGEIYFRGEKKNFSSPQTVGKIVGRPLGIRMIECENVVLQDIFLHNSAAWMQNYVYCNNLIFDGIKVVNHANYNNDGLDPDGCTNVIVRNCFINSEDDAMCLKGGSGKITKNMLIENSTFITTCNAFKLGTDTQGGFEDILIRNCILGGIPDTLESIAGNQSSSGITLATVDGGDVRNIYIHDVTINQARCPIFLRIGKRFRLLPEWEKPEIGDLEYILIENVKGKKNFRQGSFISGISDKVIGNVIIRNLHLEMEGIEQEVFAGLPVEENEWGYPDAHQFSVNGLPSYGFYIRHAKNITLEDISISTTPVDTRPEFVKTGITGNILAMGDSVPEQKFIDFSYTPKYIQNLSINDSIEKALVLQYRIGSRLYNDRGNYILEVPVFLKDAEYIQWSMKLRESTASELLKFEITEPGTLYIAHHNLYTPQQWLSNDFMNINQKLKIDRWEYDLYAKEILTPASIVLGGNHSGKLPVDKGQNYIVFFVKK